ncbi:MAG: prepilin-type N-terminal cleavage/methylation domain-containing protein [Candidatus Omnitrophota bacterium]
MKSPLNRGFTPLENKSRQRTRLSSLTGFTLPELLLAASILAFALSGLLLLFVNNSLLNSANRNLGIAVDHAQYCLEEIREKEFSGLIDSINNGNWTWSTDDIRDKHISSLNGQYVALVNETITTVLLNATDPIDVRVTVAWDDRGGKNRSLTLRTLVAGKIK